MKLWIVREELAPATIARIANSTTCGNRYILPSARRGSSISDSNSTNGASDVMATPATAVKVASQGVRPLRVAGIPYLALPRRFPSGCGFSDSPRPTVENRALNSPGVAPEPMAIGADHKRDRAI